MKVSGDPTCTLSNETSIKFTTCLGPLPACQASAGSGLRPLLGPTDWGGHGAEGWGGPRAPGHAGAGGAEAHVFGAGAERLEPKVLVGAGSTAIPGGQEMPRPLVRALLYVPPPRYRLRASAGLTLADLLFESIGTRNQPASPQNLQGDVSCPRVSPAHGLPGLGKQTPPDQSGSRREQAEPRGGSVRSAARKSQDQNQGGRRKSEIKNMIPARVARGERTQTHAHATHTRR